jgi:hypothetical protein
VGQGGVEELGECVRPGGGSKWGGGEELSYGTERCGGGDDKDPIPLLLVSP